MHLPGGLDETNGLTFTLENTVYFYNKTSVFWIPDKFKSIDELWKMDYEKGGFEKVFFSKNE